jgi:hypothetical protein
MQKATEEISVAFLKYSFPYFLRKKIRIGIPEKL